MSEVVKGIFNVSVTLIEGGWFWLIPVVIALILVFWKFQDFRESTFLKASSLAGVFIAAAVTLPFSVWISLMAGAGAKDPDLGFLIMLTAIFITELLAMIVGFAVAVCLAYPAYKIHKKLKEE